MAPSWVRRHGRLGRARLQSPRPEEPELPIRCSRTSPRPGTSIASILSLPPPRGAARACS